MKDNLVVAGLSNTHQSQPQLFSEVHLADPKHIESILSRLIFQSVILDIASCFIEQRRVYAKVFLKERCELEEAEKTTDDCRAAFFTLVEYLNWIPVKKFFRRINNLVFNPAPSK